ncbi:MAG: 30S ribosomal protein S6 [Candidatus Buchananbacteria bacterium CG10_big_fil_rev_8_21_14_0_10_42_9]|uniref:Small ribosomal subunit protein bS6 n=1 Tax=Candidatus Buchananbacteria bacterium CG10_big_fil_rev_8_21_14_0_10_42_9 TaxID=1974526 RepID=A0A2H0W1H0_9BACT|nr:MAG: 30S ribosomal protein S6 [Candidatus Buchananbacteria bacterium CG10_big_fil_rev_8_21_14_0_10_42_9]
MHYELLYIIPGTFAENEIDPVRSKVSDLVKQSGKVTAETALGKKKLAYPIKHMAQGYYEIVEFDAEPTDMKKLDTNLKLYNDVLRHLIVKKEIVSGPAHVSRERVPDAPKLVKEIPTKDHASEKKTKSIDIDKKLDEILEDNML